MGLWRNSDGLTIKYGTRDAQANVARKPSVGNALQELVLHINDASLLEDTVGTDDASFGAVIPAGAHITHANLYVTTAFAGASAVLDIGLYKVSDGTEIDDDGIDAAIATATLVDNAEIACDGAVIDTTLSVAARVHASYDTAAFTAGKAKVVIYYTMDA